MLTMNGDGSPYLRMAHAIYLVGMVGLNELVRIHRGQEMHDSEDALAFGLQVVEHMKTEADRLSAEYSLKFVFRADSRRDHAYRFARLDLKYYSPEAGHYIRGNLIQGEIYYTNSTT